LKRIAFWAQKFRLPVFCFFFNWGLKMHHFMLFLLLKFLLRSLLLFWWFWLDSWQHFFLGAFKILSLFCMPNIYDMCRLGSFMVFSVWSPKSFLYLDDHFLLRILDIFCYYLIEYIFYALACTFPSMPNIHQFQF
jgi:hypothetical protein